VQAYLQLTFFIIFAMKLKEIIKNQ